MVGRDGAGESIWKSAADYARRVQKTGNGGEGGGYVLSLPVIGPNGATRTESQESFLAQKLREPWKASATYARLLYQNASLEVIEQAFQEYVRTKREQLEKLA